MKDKIYILRKHIVETAYNVGYTAKLHFASFDIIEKSPNWVSFISIVIGILALVFPVFSTRFLSATVLILGIGGLCMGMKEREKEDYEKKGIELTNIFNELKHLMAETEKEENLENIFEKLKDIEKRYNYSCSSSHIIFAPWFAHYKFFWEQQIDWIEEYKTFSFFRDKVPLTFWIFLFFTLLISLLIVI